MRRRPAVGALLGILLAAQGVVAQNDVPGARLTVEVGPRRAEIGDRLEAVLELVIPAGTAIGEPLFPEWGDNWGDAEILEVGPAERIDEEGSPARYRQTVSVTLFRTGETILPPVAIELPTAAEVLTVTSAEPISVTVDSVLPEGEEEPTPMPPAPPRPLPVGDPFWWSLGLAAAACLALAALALRRRMTAAAAATVYVDPVTALKKALGRLANEQDPMAVISGLSLELRRYLGRRLGFPAAESTTTEIRRRLQEKGLPVGLVAPIDTLLKRCDAIKFARSPVALDRSAEHLGDAERVANALEDHLRPPAVEDQDEERAA